MKLTAKAVNVLTLPPGRGDVIFFDDAMPGFGYRLRLGAGGKVLRTWVCQYRRAGATRRLLLGSAEVVGAEAAREAAKRALGAVALGQDPQGERADRRDADKLTLRKTVDEFLAVKRRELRPRSYVETERYLTSTRYFGPILGLPLDTITRRDVATCIVRIARESGNPAATQARAKLSGLFSWAMTMGMVEANPVIGTHEPAANKSRDRVLSDSELAAIWKGCADEHGSLDEFGKIVRLLILTGCRRQEVGGMAWREFNTDGTKWTLPAERSKNHRAYTLPVLPAMRAILDTVPHMAGRDQLFGERADRGFTKWDVGKRDLDQRTGVADEWHPHDIRRTTATRMADLGVQPHIIEQVLNHQSGHKAGIAGVYNRSPYEREVRNALATWHDHIRALVEGGEHVVLPFTPAEAAS
jgi:integrase